MDQDEVVPEVDAARADILPVHLRVVVVVVRVRSFFRDERGRVLAYVRVCVCVRAFWGGDVVSQGELAIIVFVKFYLREGSCCWGGGQWAEGDKRKREREWRARFLRVRFASSSRQVENARETVAKNVGALLEDS